MTIDFQTDDDDAGPLDSEKWKMAVECLYRLRRNFEETDPNIEFESDRLELAHQTIRMFWNIYRAYVVWAQHYIAGRYMVHEYSELADFLWDRLDKNRDDLDYVYEEVGTAMGWNRQRADIPDVTDPLEEFLEENPEINLTASMRRRLFIDMCMTTNADAWWAKAVQAALQDVEYGERNPLFEPESGAHGSPSLLRHARRLATGHVRFLHGKGARKLDARLEVSEAIGVSEATLRSWDRTLCQDENDEFSLFCCEVAGRFEEYIDRFEQLKPHEIKELDDIEPQSFKFQKTVELADFWLRVLRQFDLERVRFLLRIGRERPGGQE